MIISFVVPSYNNLRYLKHAYRSIRQYAGTDHEIIVLDDASTDGTVLWLESLTDANLVIWKNPTGKRLGHTVTYNIGAKIAKNEVFGILHADMFIGPNYVENLVKHLKPGVVVSATRIEPPLHPQGKEKILKDFGMWPETFNEAGFLDFVGTEQTVQKDKTTGGIFAPWTMYKEDFLRIGGHDLLLAPFPFEDSDLFQRLMLAGYEVVQSRDSLVYHLTCRGHKWTDDRVIGKVDDEYSKFESKARRNYIRKWNSWIANDEYLRPILTNKYKTCIVLTNSVPSLIPELELWSDRLYTDVDNSFIQSYISTEQQNTLYDMQTRIKPINEFISGEFPVEIHINSSTMTQSDWNIIPKIPNILDEASAEESPAGTYVLGNISVIIHKLVPVLEELIYTTPIEDTTQYLSHAL